MRQPFILSRIPQRFPRLSYFVFGCLITVASFLLYFHGHSIIVALGIGDPAFRLWPAWLTATYRAVAYLPWIAAAALLAVRLYWGRRIRFISFAGGLMAPYLAGMVFLYVGPVVADHWNRQPFEAAVWRAESTEASREWNRYPTRLTMANDLVASGVLDGKTRPEIVALLGPAAESGGFRSVDMVYYLGPERGFISIDSEWLLITFGSDGRAEKVVIGFD